jgi:hypothetical protein
MGHTAGSGNIPWRMSRLSTQIKPGATNRKTCSVIRRDGSKCRGVAIRGHRFCYVHTGRWVIARRKLKRQKLKHRAWVSRVHQKKEEQIREEAEAAMAALLSDHPLGKGV